MSFATVIRLIVGKSRFDKAEVGYDRYESDRLVREVCPELDISSFDFVRDHGEFLNRRRCSIFLEYKVGSLLTITDRSS